MPCIDTVWTRGVACKHRVLFKLEIALYCRTVGHSQLTVHDLRIAVQSDRTTFYPKSAEEDWIRRRVKHLCIDPDGIGHDRITPRQLYRQRVCQYIFRRRETRLEKNRRLQPAIDI